MPWFDGTGPRGQGPLTGRGMGSCAVDKNVLDEMRKKGIRIGAPGRGLGGVGRGRLGLGRRFSGRFW